MRVIASTVMLWALCGMILTPVAWAGNTDPSGAQLRQLADEYLASAPAGDADAEKVRQIGSSDGFDDWDAMTVLCSIELATGVGWIIWGNRASQDKCVEKLGRKSSAGEYCRRYSVTCGHYTWNADCMKQHDCGFL